MHEKQDLKFNHCLCDLNASVSLMPQSVSKSLDLFRFKLSKISLVLSDRYVQYLEGLLENIPVKMVVVGS